MGVHANRDTQQGNNFLIQIQNELSVVGIFYLNETRFYLLQVLKNDI